MTAMKKISLLFMTACMLCAMQAYAQCETVITPSEAAAKAQAGDKGTYCIEGYVVSTVDIYTNQYKNQTFLMADERDGEPVLEAWRVTGPEFTVGIGSKVRILNAAVQMYYGKAQTKSGFRVEVLEDVMPDLNLPPFGSELTAPEAAEICLSFPFHNVPTEEMYIVSGYARAVTVDEKDKEIYSLWLSSTIDGNTVFQAYQCHAMRNEYGEIMPVKDGDWVYVTGHLSRYDKKPQIKGGVVATSKVNAYLVRVAADEGKGTAAVTGKQCFTLPDLDTLQFTLTAEPAEGYEFMMWIDPRNVNPTDPDFDSDIKVAEKLLGLYNDTKDLDDEALMAYLEEKTISPEAFIPLQWSIEKLSKPSVVFDSGDMAAWLMINGMEGEPLIEFKAVFRSKEDGVEKVQGNRVPGTKVLREGKLYIVRPDGKTYNATGVAL